MKVRVEITLDVDPEAWRDEMLVDPAAPARDIRADVRAWVAQDVSIGLRDRGLLLDGSPKWRKPVTGSSDPS